MTEQYLEAIRLYLAANNYANKDVRITIDGMVCGIWLWNDLDKCHVHMHRMELVQILGISRELIHWLDNEIAQVETSWRFINPARMRAVAGMR